MNRTATKTTKHVHWSVLLDTRYYLLSCYIVVILLAPWFDNVKKMGGASIAKEHTQYTYDYICIITTPREDSRCSCLGAKSTPCRDQWLAAKRNAKGLEFTSTSAMQGVGQPQRGTSLFRMSWSNMCPRPRSRYLEFVAVTTKASFRLTLHFRDFLLSSLFSFAAPVAPFLHSS